MIPRMIRFIRKHHVMTLATQSGEGSWTAHCFYAWMPEQQAVVFTTDPDTRHGREMLTHPGVSAGIVLETRIVGRIRGIQLTGRVEFLGQDKPSEGRKGGTEDPDGHLSQKAKWAYIRRFPFAAAAKLDLWILYIEYVKMTDNRLGFGKKLEWRRGNS